MSQIHETRLRVVSLRWTMNPDKPEPPGGGGTVRVRQVIQVDNLSDPGRVQVVNGVASFERMVIPYTMNFTEAVVSGLVVRRPTLTPRDVRVNGFSDTTYEPTDWPTPELYIWQATDDIVYYGRAADGVQVPLFAGRVSEIDLAMRITFQSAGLSATNIVASIQGIPVVG